MALLNRLPILYGPVLPCGWIAGDVIATDPAVHPSYRHFSRPVGPARRVAGVVRSGAAFANGGHGARLFARCWVVVVLVAGSIWRSTGCRTQACRAARH